jgi:hypothetical protein
MTVGAAVQRSNHSSLSIPMNLTDFCPQATISFVMPMKSGPQGAGRDRRFT